jgi:CRP/FNR family transcriptional regulator
LLPDYARPSPVVARTRRYERGERIFEEGTTSDLFYTTTSGSVKFVKTSTQGNESIVGIASGICPLSPDGLDSGRTFRVTAVALEDTTCIQVPRRELVALFKEYPTVALRLYQELCERLDASFTWIADLSRGTVEVRLAQLFLGLARTGGRVQGSATFIPIRLSRQELADAVGTTVETCIRVMSRWSERRFVYASDAGFIVGDADRLELLAHATTPHPERAAHSPSTRPLPPGGYGWHTVTELDRRRHGRWDRFDVCPACWPVHTRVANELTRVQLNAPTSAGSRGRCHWCDTRRALAR